MTKVKIEKYIPKQFRAYVMDAYRDEDGYWVEFSDYVDTCYDTHSGCFSCVHEDTIAELKKKFKSLKFVVPVYHNYNVHPLNGVRFTNEEDMIRYRKFYRLFKSCGCEFK